MRAIVCERYGPPSVLRWREVPMPVPKDDEVLVRVQATTVTSADCRVRSQTIPRGFGVMSRLVFGVTKPRQAILGTEFAGEVAAVGKAVRSFAPGDQMFGMAGVRMACHAEYKCVPESGALAIKPPNLTFEEAAALPFGGTTAVDFLRRGRLRRGESILVNGASGAVGTAVVQLARHFGAEVTAVCSAPNHDLVRSLGASHAIDYTSEDFTRNGQRYDIIVDTAGTAPYSRSRASLKERGRLLLVRAELPDMLPIPWVSLTSGRRISASPAIERAEDLRFLAGLAEAGEFRPVIDRRYRFDQIVEAHTYVDSGRKRGNVVVTL